VSKNRRTTNHVVALNGGGFRCLHCFTTQDMPQSCDIDVYLAASRAFINKHARCQAPSEPRCDFCHSAEHTRDKHVNATCRWPQDWPRCGDVGTSSMALWNHFQRGHAPCPNAPVDPDDFGRCYRLLHAPWAATWRERIDEMVVYPEWGPLVAQWADMERLYEEERPSGQAPKLYALMQRLRGVA
jgi:hypothetical protein